MRYDIYRQNQNASYCFKDTFNIRHSRLDSATVSATDPMIKNFILHQGRHTMSDSA